MPNLQTIKVEQDGKVTRRNHGAREVGRLLEWLAPDAELASVLELDKPLLDRLGATAVIFDLDNTLVAYGHAEPSEAVRAHLRHLAALDIGFVLLSNALTSRAADLAAKLRMPYIGQANKPSADGFRRACAMLDRPPARTAVVGDQLFRDILGARRAGCPAVLVRPLSVRDFPGTALLRPLEAATIAFLKRRSRWPRPS